MLQNVRAEKALCISIVSDMRCMAAVAEKLKPEHFFDKQCARIYECAFVAYAKQEPYSVYDINECSGIEIEEFISDEHPMSPDTTSQVADRIISLYKRRKLLEALEKAKDDLVNGREPDLGTLANFDVSEEIIHVKSASDIIGDIEEYAMRSVADLGTGIDALDQILNVEEGAMTVIAARPSMGKTGLAVTISRHLLENGEGVLFFSLEMPARQIGVRMLAQMSGLGIVDIRNQNVAELKAYKKAVERFKTYPFFCVDAVVDEMQLYTKASMLIRAHPEIKNVFVDHLAYIRPSFNYRSEHEKMGAITKMLKKLAKDFKIKVWPLSQLNRKVEERPNKRPMLADLRASGSIEEDADNIIAIYRESYYKSKARGELEPAVNEAEIIVLKQRDGAVGTAKCLFDGRSARFFDGQLARSEPAVHPTSI